MLFAVSAAEDCQSAHMCLMAHSDMSAVALLQFCLELNFLHHCPLAAAASTELPYPPRIAVAIILYRYASTLRLGMVC